MRSIQIKLVKFNYFIISILIILTSSYCNQKNLWNSINKASLDKEITSFNFSTSKNKALSSDIIGIINESTVNAIVPFGTDISSLRPDIIISGQSINPKDGASIDFTSSVKYTVTAADNSKKEYTITVDIAPNHAKDILTFRFLASENLALNSNVISIIDNTTVNATVPFGTDVTHLRPDITISGQSINPSDGEYVNFTNPVSYIVKAADGSIKKYTITLDIAPNHAKDILTFEFLASENSSLAADVTCTVNNSTVNAIAPFGTNVTNLKPDITISGQSTNPSDGEYVDFTNPVTYIVTAANGTTKEYTITLDIAPNHAKDILTFEFLASENLVLSENVVGSVHDFTVEAIVPFGTDVTNLKPDITITGQSINPSDGEYVDFTNPVTYVVTAADGDTKGYTVIVNIAPNDAKDILAFEFLASENLSLSTDIVCMVNESTINATVPFDTAVSSLRPNITISGTSINPSDGEPVDFTNPVLYTVTAADSSEKEYTVFIDIAPSDSKDIITFDFLAHENMSLSSDAIGIVTNYAVNVIVPFDTDVSSLIPDIIISGHSINPSDGESVDFTNPVSYIVKAADSSTKEYTVTVQIEAPKAWKLPSGPTDNISPDNNDATNPQIAMDNNENAIIVWEQENSSGILQIFKSEYRSKIWTHPVNLNDNISPDNNDATNPQVAMDNNENAIIVWEQEDSSGNTQIFMSEYRSKIWTHPENVEDNISPNTEHAINPRVAMDNTGNVMIVWEQKDNSGKLQIFKSEYRSGIWTHPANLDDNVSPNTEHATNTRVAMDNTENVMIVWEQKDNSGKLQIFKSEYRSGIWTHPANLNDNVSPDSEDAEHPQVAMDNSGNAMIVWEQKDNSGKLQIFKSEYRSGIWTHPANLDDNVSPDSEDAEHPQVAMDNSGNAIISWRQLDSSHNWQIFMSEYSSGTWKHPANYDDNISPDNEDAMYPRIAMDNGDNHIIVWRQDDGSSYQIFKSEYRNRTWTHPADINDRISSISGDVSDPNVAMDNIGNTVIVWSQSDTSDDQIFISEYR
ncbi:MAG: hypothetical protein SVZ03_11490 [Spirochaetota bacterium]|nr:hypothetical protein [Spirochaetota bacterium]